MKFDRRTLLILPALAVAGLSLPGGPAGTAEAAQGRPARASLCTAGEVVIFQCGIGRKLVAVCGSRTPGGGAQYRYGSPGRVELASPPGRLSYAREAYSGGGALQLRFSSGGYDYAVYSRTIRTGFGRGGNNPAFSDGLFVRQGGRLVSNRACTTAVTGNARPEAHMPEGSILDWPE